MLWKATAADALEREKNIASTYDTLRSTLDTMEQACKRNDEQLLFDADTIRQICEAADVCFFLSDSMNYFV